MFLVSIILFALLWQCNSRTSHEVVQFGLYKLFSSTWAEVSDQLACWSGPGGYWRFTNETIIDNIYLYTPCPVHYGIKNPCAWILDFDSLKYTWDPNYEVNNKCKDVASDSFENKLVYKNGSMNNRTDVNRLHRYLI